LRWQAEGLTYGLAPLHVSMRGSMVAHVYVDGFALYHMCYRGLRNEANQSLKWLDLVSLSRALLPDEEVDLVRYYTARVGDTPEDNQRALRQDVYLRALATLPEISIHQG